MWLIYGPFFAWLPVTPGFVRDRRNGVEILHRPGTPLTAAQERFASAATEAERAIGLSFTRPVRIVLCDRWEDLRRFMPWLPVNRGLGARTLPIGHIVYVTPLVRDRNDADMFVRHELIHVLLHQHMPIARRLDGGKPAWLIEGTATLFGNPQSYPSGADLTARLRSVDVGRLLTDAPSAPGGATLFYAVSRDFVALLQSRYGRVRLQAFLAGYVVRPSEWPSTFTAVFGEPFDTVLSVFAAAEGGTNGRSPLAASQAPLAASAVKARPGSRLLSSS